LAIFKKNIFDIKRQDRRFLCMGRHNTAQGY
jgi:hypothetical protein